MTLIKIGPIWGVPNREELPSLPRGYSYRLRAGEWAAVIGPNGMEWFVYNGEKPKLVRCLRVSNPHARKMRKRASEFGFMSRFRPGDVFIESRQQVLISYLLSITP